MLFRIARFASISLLAFVASACTYDTGHRHDCVDNGNCPSNQPPVSDVIAQSTIDTDATLEIEAGVGAGAFVEYQTGGTWRVTTACDTTLSGYGCTWDIIAGVGAQGSISAFAPEDLEADDYLDWHNSRALRMVAETTTDFDGFSFEATPGATVRIDVYLDGAPAPRYIYWVGAGGLHQGSPTNPLDLTPSAP